MSAPAQEPRTSSPLADLRANSLHRLLQRRRDVRTVDAIHGCSELFAWPREKIAEAIADLVADGMLEESPHGKLIVRRRAA